VNKETKEVSYKEAVCDSDDCNKPGTTLETLAALKPIMLDANPQVQPKPFKKGERKDANPTLPIPRAGFSKEMLVVFPT